MSDTFQGKGRPDHRRGPRPRSVAGAALRPKGASIVGTDLCGRIATVKYPTSTCTHLNQTVNQAEEVGQKMVAQIGEAHKVSGTGRMAMLWRVLHVPAARAVSTPERRCVKPSGDRVKGLSCRNG
jgi:hypothetical protein